MSSFKLWLLGLSLLLTLTFGDEEEPEAAVESNETVEEVPEFVVTLSEENFAEAVSTNERTLVEFYAPWCGHCKALAPEYEEAARILVTEKKSPTVLAKVDATENQALAAQFDVKGYPTLVLIEKGSKESTPFDGGRDSKAIVDWVLKHDIPAFTLITTEEFEEGRGKEVDLESEPKRECARIEQKKKKNRDK